MRNFLIAAAFTVAAVPAYAQGVPYVAPNGSSYVDPADPYVMPAPRPVAGGVLTRNPGYVPTSPEVGVRGAVAADARAYGYGTPEIAPNGSSYVPSARAARADRAPSGYVDSRYGDVATGSILPVPRRGLAPLSSADIPSNNPAADGNANLLTRLQPNYGNVSGGYLAAEE